jgi:hypothetical protein
MNNNPWVKAEIKPEILLENYYCKVSTKNNRRVFYATVLITADGQWQMFDYHVLEWLNTNAITALIEDNERLKGENETLQNALEFRLQFEKECDEIKMTFTGYQETITRLTNELTAARKKIAGMEANFFTPDQIRKVQEIAYYAGVNSCDYNTGMF